MAITNYSNTKNELEIALNRLDIIKDNKENLEVEKNLLENYVEKLKKCILEIEKNLKELTGIEYQLYYEVVVNGLNVTKAVDKVAYKYDKDVSTLWKSYYPNVKAKINLLKNH